MKTLPFIIIALALIASSCSKDKTDECIEYRQATFMATDIPDTVSVNEEAKIHVKVSIDNGCGTFNKFEEITRDYTKTIQAIVKYEGCTCTQMASFVDTAFIFKPVASGTYLLQFLQKNNSMTTDTVIVIQ